MAAVVEARLPMAAVVAPLQTRLKQPAPQPAVILRGGRHVVL
jgi:hypothetical protein